MSDADPSPPPDPEPVPFVLTGAKTLVGRKRESDLVVPDSKCSKFHARIYREEDGFRLLDLGSQNGTFVNEERVTSKILETGDRIRFGYSVYRFLEEGEGEEGRATLSFVKKVQPLEGGEEPDDVAEGEPAGPAPAADAAPPPDGEGSGKDAPAASDRPDTERLPAVRAEAPATPAAPAGRSSLVRGLFVAGGILLLALAILFADDLRRALGLDDTGSAVPALAPPVETAVAPPGTVTSEDLISELDRLEARLGDAIREKDTEDLAKRIDALRRELGGRLGAVESRTSTLLATVEALRRELAAARAEAAKAGAGRGKAEEKRPELPPEEKLVREIMDALNKGE